jgi:hypothetical protein
MYSKIIYFQKNSLFTYDINRHIILKLLNPFLIINTKNIYLFNIYINYIHNFNYTYSAKYNKSLLLLCCEANFIEGVKQLIKKNVDINFISLYPYTALIFACRYEFRDIIDILLNHPNLKLDLQLITKFNQGQFAIHICVIYSDSLLYPSPHMNKKKRCKIDIIKLIQKYDNNITIHPKTYKLARLKGITLLPLNCR